MTVIQSSLSRNTVGSIVEDMNAIVKRAAFASNTSDGELGVMLTVLAKVVARTSKAIRDNVDHPPLPEFCKMSFMPSGLVRFYVSKGVFYDCQPGDNAKEFRDMVEGFYEENTQLSELTCEMVRRAKA